MTLEEIRIEYETSNIILHKNTIKNIERLLSLLSNELIEDIDDAYSNQNSTFSIFWYKNDLEFSLEIGIDSASYYYETKNIIQYKDLVPIDDNILYDLKDFYSNGKYKKINRILK